MHTADDVNPKLVAPVALSELTVKALPVDDVRPDLPCPDIGKVRPTHARPRTSGKLSAWTNWRAGMAKSVRPGLLNDVTEPGC